MKTINQIIADKINKAHDWREGQTSSYVDSNHVSDVLSKPPMNHPVDMEIHAEHKRLTRRRRRAKL